MQFLPEVQEIYISKLRNHIHNSIYKHGVSEKILRLAKKINIHSMLHSEHMNVPTDMALYCAVLLYCAQAQLAVNEKRIDIKISGDGTYFVDRRLLCAILCESAILASENSEINVALESHGIRITYEGAPPSKIFKRLVHKDRAVMLKIKKCNIYSVFLHLQPTDEKSEKITGAVTLLTDPLSPIKIFTAKI